MYFLTKLMDLLMPVERAQSVIRQYLASQKILMPIHRDLIYTFLLAAQSQGADNEKIEAHLKALVQEFIYLNREHKFLNKNFMTVFETNEIDTDAFQQVFKQYRVPPFMVTFIKDRMGKYKFILGTLPHFDLKKVPQVLLFQNFLTAQALFNEQLSKEDEKAIELILNEYYANLRQPDAVIELIDFIDMDKNIFKPAEGNQ